MKHLDGLMMRITRPELDNYNIKYLQKAVRAARVLRIIPAILLVGISGSLASGRTKKGSDIDFFIVCKDRRLFTSRFWSKLLLWQSARRNRDRKPAGKICLNYYLAQSSLDFKPHSDYVAKDYQNAIVLVARGDTLDRLVKANQWLGPKFNLSYLERHSREGGNPPNQSVDSRLRGNDKTEGGNGTKEEEIARSRCNILGNLVEKGLKRIQIKKIKKDPLTAKYPQKIVFSDTELRFHPPKVED